MACVLALATGGWYTVSGNGRGSRHSRRLLWDGTAWYWSGFPGTVVQDLRIILALSSRVWIRIADAEGRVAWLYLHCGPDPRLWRAVRRALAFPQAAVKPR